MPFSVRVFFSLLFLCLSLANPIPFKKPSPPQQKSGPFASLTQHETTFDCTMREIILKASIRRLSWFSDFGRVYDALRLADCQTEPPPTKKLQFFDEFDSKNSHFGDFVRVWVSSSKGDDRNDGRTPNSPVRTLLAARSIARKISGEKKVIYMDGIFYENLKLDAFSDSFTTWKSWNPNSLAIISGGIPLRLSWRPSKKFQFPVISAKLPSEVLLQKRRYSLFDGETGRRLPLAREPNGDVETMMQPIGWALCVPGMPNGTLPTPSPISQSVHYEIDFPFRNNSNFPVWGRDNDPRNPGIGYVWYTEGGGAASWFERNRTFWGNKTVPGGLRWNSTGGIDHSGFRASGFNATNWKRTGSGRRAHVFHSSLWGNWIYDVKEIDDFSKTMTFSSGGFQEGRGGDIRKQPFFLEGEEKALDSPTEWWIDVETGEIHFWPNSTKPPSLLILPDHENVLNVQYPVRSVAFENIEFRNTEDGLMEQYTVPEAGDWSLRRNGAVVFDGVMDSTMKHCKWVRVGGNGVVITGHSSNISILECDFLLPGSSGIVVVGYAPKANLTSKIEYPSNILIKSSIFEGIGVLGKQSSALFVSVACNVTITDSVLFSGPRAGININDGFCGGHVITRSVLFDWVRETQDHGPINTWNRQMYVNNSNPKNSTYPTWFRVTHNAILNGPSSNRDLGNLWPAVDNDDGSSMYWVANNLMIYGGGKNYLGNDKVWDGNLIVYPERWSGDTCICAWGGKNEVYSNNICITPDSDTPQYFDSSVSGDVCNMNYMDPAVRDLLVYAHSNVYHTLTGKFFWGCDKNSTWDELQKFGQERGSKVVKGYNLQSIVDQAYKILGL